MKLRPSILLLLSGLALVACAPQSGSQDPAQASATAAPTPSILERMVAAPFDTAYRGKRRVSFRYDVEGEVRSLEYEEDVASDGAGQFRVQTTAVHYPAMSGNTLDVFLLRQQAYDTFFYLHRDFRIRDVALFLQNYGLRQSPTNSDVAGRECVAITVRPRGNGGDIYRADVDIATGLVLRWKEWNASGACIASVEFIEFTPDPDLTGVDLHGPSLSTTPLDFGGNVVAQIGYAVPRPRFVPERYRQMKTEKVTVGNSAWARITYGDGVEQIFYLFQSPTIGTMPSTLPGIAMVDSVTLSQVGPWTAASGQIGGRRYIVMGKVAESVLLDMIQSAL